MLRRRLRACSARCPPPAHSPPPPALRRPCAVRVFFASSGDLRRESNMFARMSMAPIQDHREEEAAALEVRRPRCPLAALAVPACVCPSRPPAAARLPPQPTRGCRRPPWPPWEPRQLRVRTTAGRRRRCPSSLPLCACRCCTAPASARRCCTACQKRGAWLAGGVIEALPPPRRHCTMRCGCLAAVRPGTPCVLPCSTPDPICSAGGRRATRWLPWAQTA